MKKFVNNPNNFVEETLEGILLAYPDELKTVSLDYKTIIRKDAPIKGKVALATGGGSGHLPVFLGYVGRGLADGASVGNVFSSPSANQMLEVTKAVNGGVGVLYLYGNYFGDTMNFDLAAEMARKEDIEVDTVRVYDDVASMPRENKDRRRGVAGLFFAYKIAGAAAEEMKSLPEVKRVAQKSVDNMGTMGVGLTPCVIPASGKPNFTINDDQMEIGMGIHGEPGIKRVNLESADYIAEYITNAVIEDIGLINGDKVAVLVNSLGATSKEELYILYRRVYNILGSRGISIYKNYIGEYATSLEMAGSSITLLRLDEELEKYLDAPALSPFFIQK